MKMIEAVKASPQRQAIREDPEGRGWWYGFGDKSYCLRDQEGESPLAAPAPDLNFMNANDWIPVMDLSCTMYPQVLWEASKVVWESKKLRRQVSLLRAYTAYMAEVIKGLVNRLGVEARDEVIGIAMRKLREKSEELRQLDKRDLVYAQEGRNDD